MYSLSKALLNAGTKLLYEKIKKNNKDCIIFSLCPGNFVSPMSTEEELVDAVPADEVARFIYSVREISPSKISGGCFYTKSGLLTLTLC